MSKLGKFLICLFFLISANITWAGEAILGDLGLTIYSENEKISGFFNIIGTFDHPCYFLFQQINKNSNINEKVGDYSVSDISVFIPDSKSGYIEDQFRNFHTDGTLYQSDKIYTSGANDGMSLP